MKSADDIADRLVGQFARRSDLVEAEAEIARLRAALAAKGDTEDEASDVDQHEPGKPPKGKKKVKVKGDNEEDDEGEPAEDSAPKPDDERDKRPAPPAENDDERRKDGALSEYERACKATADAVILAHERARGLSAPKPTATDRRVAAANDALLIAEVRAGFHRDEQHIAAQICACDRVRRGVSNPPPLAVNGPATRVFRPGQPRPELLGSRKSDSESDY
jgi:hypothetical protein